jgi:predicted phage terminase large subunit-like protein
VRGYLFHDLTFPSPPCHGEVYDYLANEDWNDYWLAVAAPRSFAKSTLCTKFLPLFIACTRWRGLWPIDIISATSEFAEERLRLIRHELETNKLLHRDFGYQVGKRKWTNSQIILRNGVDIRARGAGKQTRGRRPRLVICDDIEDDEAVRSEVQRDKLERWYNKALVNTLEEQGCRLIHIGTLLHPLCLLTRIIDNNPASANVDYSQGWIRKKYAAINPDGTAAWPEKWPLEALQLRKQKIGTEAFLAEFMNEPRITENPIFRKEWIQYCDRKDMPPLNELYRIASCDPAISKSEDADYTAHGVIGVQRSGEMKGHIWVIDAERGHWSTYDTTKALLHFYKEYNPSQLIIESNAYQAALKEVVLREAAHQGLYPPVKEIKALKDKRERAMGVQHLFRNGWIHIPRDLRWLADELVLFDPVKGGNPDDGVDMLVHALTEAQKYQGQETTRPQKAKERPYQSWQINRRQLGKREIARVL